MNTPVAQDGVIHGVAIDAGSGLTALLEQARGSDSTADDLFVFKRNVLEVLGLDANTVLVDATLGPRLTAHYPNGCEKMMALEADVYYIADDDRMTMLPEHLTAADYASYGVSQLKFFMYYAPDDDTDLNARKQQLVARLGQDCRDNDLVFVMEPLVYLSAGVTFERFEASLLMAGEAGVRFDGFMCGRALWSDAIAEFGHHGEAGLREWLQQTGRTRLRKLIDAVSTPA